MSFRLTQEEVAEARVIKGFTVEKGRGMVTLLDTTYRVEYDDLLDFVQAMESLMLKVSGKLLQRKFVPPLTNREALKITRMVGGEAAMYDGSVGEAPESGGYYLLVEIEGNRWDNWFSRIDELIKCLYVIVREAQADPYVKPIVEVVQ